MNKFLLTTCLITAVVINCSAEEDRERKPLQHPIGTGGSAGETTTSAMSSGEGGSGGIVDAGPCDAWADESCCAPSSFCKEGSLGPCLVDIQLCNGMCSGKANPAPAKCGDGGMCIDGGCVN